MSAPGVRVLGRRWMSAVEGQPGPWGGGSLEQGAKLLGLLRNEVRCEDRL